MAGIKRLEKTPDYINFLTNNLLVPDTRKALFDDALGWEHISAMLYSPSTIIYGIFERGLPEPIGMVVFVGVMPYRGCDIKAVIFDPEKRKQGLFSQFIDNILIEVITDNRLRYVSARVIGDKQNDALNGFLEKLGFKYLCRREDSVFSGGEYQNVHEYHLVVGKREEAK